MKKLLIVAIILLLAVLMTQMVPDKQAHKEAMMEAITEFVDEEAEQRGFGDNVLTNLGKGVVLKTVETALNSKLTLSNLAFMPVHKPSMKFLPTLTRLPKPFFMAVGIFFTKPPNLPSRVPKS